MLGIIVTMGHMDAAPAEIGHHVAAALVGTFLGILMCYGVLGPLASNAETQEVHQLRFLLVIRAAVIASARGVAPPTAVEFGRKMIFSDERPSFAEVDKALQFAEGARDVEAARARRIVKKLSTAATVTTAQAHGRSPTPTSSPR